MTIRPTVAALLALGLGLLLGPDAASAQHIQPEMRTMIQQGGAEPGPLLGYILPGPEAAERIFREDEAWARQARAERLYRRHYGAGYDAPRYLGAAPRRVIRAKRAHRRVHRPVHGMR